MRRTFLSNKLGMYEEDKINLILEGIQNSGGEIVSVALSPYGMNCALERLLIVYEDHDNNEEIKKFLSF